MFTLLIRSPASMLNNTKINAIQLKQRMLAQNRDDSMLPINDPVTGATLPEFVAGRFQAKIRPQLVHSQRLTCQGVCLAPLQMLVDSGTLV